MKPYLLVIGYLISTLCIYAQDSTKVLDTFYRHEYSLLGDETPNGSQSQPTSNTRIFEKETGTDFLDQAGVSLGNAFQSDPNNNINPQAEVRTFQWQFYFGTNQREVNKGYFTIRNAFTLGSFEYEPGKNVSEIATELAGTEIMNPYGGMFSMTVGQRRHAIFKSNNERLFHWEVGGKVVAVNKALFLGDEASSTIGGLPIINAFAEYSYAVNLSQSSFKNKADHKGYLLITLLGGGNYTPIFSESNVYNLIFQDELGNPAKPYGLFVNPELEVKLGSFQITAGGILRWPDADIFGFEPRWYFSISGGQ